VALSPDSISLTLTGAPPMPTLRRLVDPSGLSWSQCYDFLNIFAKIYCNNMGAFYHKKQRIYLCKKIISKFEM
jgi:hypothetical protein